MLHCQIRNFISVLPWPLVTCIIKTPWPFLRLLPVDMAISSAPVLTGEKSQVSGRQWDRGVNDILSNYLSPLHRLVLGLEETTWDKQLYGKRFWSPRWYSAPLPGPRCSLRVLKWYQLKYCGINKCKHIDSKRTPGGDFQPKSKWDLYE